MPPVVSARLARKMHPCLCSCPEADSKARVRTKEEQQPHGGEAWQLPCSLVARALTPETGQMGMRSPDVVCWGHGTLGSSTKGATGI